MGKKYGYVRVSTREQNEDRQLYSMQESGVEKKNIFVDKQSGCSFERPGYLRMMKKLKQGDVLYLHSIDRLGRNYEEILQQWQIITKEKRVDVVVLDMPLLNTGAREQDLTGTFIADLVLQILSYVAQTERDNIRKRQAEGIAAAKRKGIHCGREPKLPPDDFEEVVKGGRDHSYSGKEAAKKLGVSRTYLYKYARAQSDVIGVSFRCWKITPKLTIMRKL